MCCFVVHQIEFAFLILQRMNKLVKKQYINEHNNYKIKNIVEVEQWRDLALCSPYAPGKIRSKTKNEPSKKGKMCVDGTD